MKFKCVRCRCYRDESCFSPTIRKPHALARSCDDCRAKYAAWYAANADYKRKYVRLRYALNKDSGSPNESETSTD